LPFNIWSKKSQKCHNRRLYDDGGLTLLLPYILKTRAKFSKCQMRVFFLANKMNTLDEEARSMAALLVHNT
jgi:solute carrier family 12 sodium/potassium/chloride transporter 2